MHLVGRQQVRDSVYNLITHSTLRTVERAGNYFHLIFFLYLQLKLSLAYRAHQNINNLLFHSVIISYQTTVFNGVLRNTSWEYNVVDNPTL